MKRKLISLFFLLFLFSACQVPSNDIPVMPTDTLYHVQPTTTTTATPEPLDKLTVCTAALPESLFLYEASKTPAKENILVLIQDELFENVDGTLIPIILEKVPTQADGDLRLEPVSVQRGQSVVDARGELVVFSSGVLVRPSGCRDSDCAIIWDGEETLEMDQMVLEFNLRDNLTWSDGVPLTALDSVFSFQLAGASEAPGLKWAEERTDRYTAIDDHSLVWIGLPGFTTAAVERLFWEPIPSHLFDGSESWADIANDHRLVESPLSYGPYMIAFYDGSMITFTSNPYYFRADEGLPFLDEIIYKVIGENRNNAWEQLKSGGCDLLDSTFRWEENPTLLNEIRLDDRFDIIEIPGESWTQLVFGIQPASYDAYYNPIYDDRPDILGDVRTRKAIAMSLDRAAMLETTMGDMGDIWSSFISPDKSQIEEGDGISYDPEMSAELLYQAGWRDHDGNPETPLQAWAVENVPMGTQLVLDLLITQSGYHQELADHISDDLRKIGIGVSVSSVDAKDLYAPGPDGLIFGRQFDLAILAWQPLPDLDCGFYQTWQIPSAENRWIGTNVAGFSHSHYDSACADASLALPGDYADSLYTAETVFIEYLPAAPLMVNQALMILRKNDCGGDFEGNGFYHFETIEFYQYENNCP